MVVKAVGDGKRPSRSVSRETLTVSGDPVGDGNLFLLPSPVRWLPLFLWVQRVHGLLTTPVWPSVQHLLLEWEHQREWAPVSAKRCTADLGPVPKKGVEWVLRAKRSRGC